MELGLLSAEMCFLVGRRKAAELSETEFRVEHQQLTTRLRAWRDTLHPRLTDPVNLVTRLSSPTTTTTRGRERNSTKLFNYFPNNQAPLYAEPFCFTTAMICEWHSVVLMHLCQAAGNAPAEAATIAQLGEMAQHAVAVCEIIEAAERWPMVPRGLLMMLHPALGMASVFLPRSARVHMWLRKKFAWLESCG